MKKLLAIVVLGLLWSGNIFAKTGKGDLILDTYDLEKFIQYILGAGNEKRATSTGTGLLFVVSPSGGSAWWYCMAKSANNCKTPIDRKVEMHCEKNYSAGEKCYVFARKNKIVWKNSVNSKKDTIITSKNPFDIANKVKELGFFNGDVSALNFPDPKNPNKFIENETNIKNSYVTEQLKTLNKLKQQGIITKDDFEKAKIKLLYN